MVFDGTPDVISHELRYFTEEREFPPGRQALVLCYRRSGVISGYIVKRDEAHACATDRFDGTLYYQMHLTASILLQRPAVFTPQVLVLCRSNEPPDFGHSEKERETYTPGRYTPQARLNMVRGALSILTELPSPNRDELLEAVRHDYANYFYPFIKDQLTLPVAAYFKLYRDYWSLGFGKYPLFHVYCIGCYALGEKLFDRMTRVVRKRLGRTVQIGMPTR